VCAEWPKLALMGLAYTWRGSLRSQISKMCSGTGSRLYSAKLNLLLIDIGCRNM
jgi:hypothetical protein